MMQRQPAVHPHVSTFTPEPVLVEQVLLPQTVEEAFARLTAWRSLPALVPVSPMLEPVRGGCIDIPSEPGDMLLGRGNSGALEQVYLVVSAVSQLLWTVVARPLRDDEDSRGYQLTVAFSAVAGGRCLIVVQIVGAANELIDRNDLRARLERIRSLMEGASKSRSYPPPLDTALLPGIIRRLCLKIGACIRSIVTQYGATTASAN